MSSDAQRDIDRALAAHLDAVRDANRVDGPLQIPRYDDAQAAEIVRRADVRLLAEWETTGAELAGDEREAQAELKDEQAATENPTRSLTTETESAKATRWVELSRGAVARSTIADIERQVDSVLRDGDSALSVAWWTLCGELLDSAGVGTPRERTLRELQQRLVEASVTPDRKRRIERAAAKVEQLRAHRKDVFARIKPRLAEVNNRAYAARGDYAPLGNPEAPGPDRSAELFRDLTDSNLPLPGRRSR